MNVWKTSLIAASVLTGLSVSIAPATAAPITAISALSPVPDSRSGFLLAV